MDVRFILTLMSFLAFLSFLVTFTDLPEQLKFITPFDFAWFSGSLVTLTGACVIASGIPCGAAVTVWGIATIFTYIVLTFEWVKLLFFMPLVVTMIFVVMKLARG